MIMPAQLKIAILMAVFAAFSVWQCRCCNRRTKLSVALFWNLMFFASFVTAVTAAVWWAFFL